MMTVVHSKSCLASIGIMLFFHPQKNEFYIQIHQWMGLLLILSGTFDILAKVEMPSLYTFRQPLFLT